jgi:nucleotide-binding universal stress UspA family protein
VGYDGSKVADDVMKLAHKHAQAFNAEVHIVTSLEQGPGLKKEEIDKAENRLEKQRTFFRADEIPCEVHAAVSYNSPGEDLVQLAKENEIDQIMIGIRRRSKVGKLVFGSTAQYVILEAPCPVVAVK